jgi:hypothetical protein
MRVTISISEEEMNNLKKYCSKSEMKISSVMRLATRRYLEKENKTRKNF